MSTLRAVLFAAVLAVSSFAQSTDAVLSGSVLDASGAIVPSATVVATNVKTGVTSSALSNASGVYQFAALQPGDYRVTAEKPGFRKLVMSDQRLAVGARVTLNLSLEVGATTESVEVVASAEAPISVVTSSVGGSISGQRILDLPVASRNAMDLVLTQAGVSSSGNNFAGGRIGQINVTVDGVSNMDNVINSGISVSIVTTSVDRIEEVKVLTAPADAEYGRGGGQVQLISRSGTNQFHGSVYEFNRNAKLAANSWSNNRSGIAKNFLNRNQTGGRIGGPIIKNKTFFFFLFESQLIRQTSTATTTVYTDTAKQGIFRFYPGVTNGNANSNNPVVDQAGNPVTPTGATGALQAVNLFGRDPSRMTADPTGQIAKILALYPKPNNFLAAGDGLNTAGYVWRRPQPDDTYTYNFRADHNFNGNERLTVTYTHDKETIANGFLAAPVPTMPGGAYSSPDMSVTVALTSALRPTVLNEFRAGMSRYDVRFLAAEEVAGLDFLPKIGTTPFAFTFPSITNPRDTSNDPQGRKSPVYQYSDNISWLRGAHAFKAGVGLTFASDNGYTSFTVLPRVNIGQGNGAFTGIDATGIPGLGGNQTGARNLLSTLAGTVASISQSFNSPGGANPVYLPGQYTQRTFRARELNWFVKDDWKVTRNLTLNLGMRWEYYGVPYEANGNMTGLVGGSGAVFGLSGNTYSALFNPGVLPGALTQQQLIGRRSPNPNVGPYGADRNNFAPAVGLSWAIPWFGKDKTVFRAGYGWSYERNALGLLDQTYGFGAPGLTESATFSPASYLALTGTSLPLAPSGKPLSLIPVTDRNQSVIILDNGLRTPYVQTWNVSLARAITSSLLLDVRYVGSKGTRLVRGTSINETNVFENGIAGAYKITQAGGNAPLLDAIFKGQTVTGLGAVDGVRVFGSDYVRANSTSQPLLANNDLGGFADFLNRSTLITGVRGGLLRLGGLPENFIVANPQFNAARLTGNHANSTYNSLQIEVTRRFANGFSYQGSYVFSKTLGEDPGSGQSLVTNYITNRNRRADKRLLSFDQPHVFRNSGTFEFPFGPGRKFLNGRNGVLSRLVERWEVGVIFNKFSGSPLGLSAGTPTGGSGTPADTFNFFGGATPVALGPIDKNFGQVQKVGNNIVYFQGWTAAPDPQVQNLAANLRTVAGMTGIKDASGNLLVVNPSPGTLGGLAPVFLRGPGSFGLNADIIKRITVNERFSAELRGDFINLLNRPTWGNPTTSINSSSFGQITSAGGTRTIVLGARINF